MTSDTGLALPGAVSETGLDLESDLSFEDWEQVGDTLARIGRAHQWWVGDWLNYGERTYGEKYAQAMDVTGLDYTTLNGCRWVAQEIESVRRRTSLSWSHHKEVAALDSAEQDEWLDRAEAKEWSRNQLRENLRAAEGAAVSVRCPTCNSMVRAEKLQGSTNGNGK